MNVYDSARMAELLAPLGYAPTEDAGDHFGQTVIGLWSHDEIDGRLARHDLGPFGLRHAACDGNQHGLAFLSAGRFHAFQLA